MDMRQLRYLVAVADAGSFLRAAQDLHISQPALTKAIKALEQSVQVRLFDRGARGVTLTVFGERLYGYGKKSVEEFERVRQELRADRNMPSGSRHDRLSADSRAPGVAGCHVAAFAKSSRGPRAYRRRI